MEFPSKSVPKQDFHREFPSKSVPEQDLHMEFPSKSVPEQDVAVIPIVPHSTIGTCDSCSDSYSSP